MTAPLPRRREQLVVPDLGLGAAPLAVSLWLVPTGATVLAGDRVVELVAGAATIDLEAPVSGRLVAQLAEEDEAVTAGSAIAEFEVDE
ncbi:MAG: lipoyl domain-containing protein [Planctomycetota bacterium]|jgi:2-oxoisovalerate dehydrogenase E2 component (dihydrolipoyl transacylase)